MFLKSIEIRGFKSFADKTDLTFKQGVTVVVGPNGSGKSNISDAVRWVLGEQSIKNLRGDKMEDVIFAGTQYRKAVGLAQVALTLDNSDSELDIAYSQVTVARRLYRSGDSEYLINNTVCRLKDVQALFMDTGIGKEGYSIIGQGKIDAILSAKSEDRRKLLEEAAGIVKYKNRKEEAEKRLENTEQNLIRINDIISTYEERLPDLESDCEKAKVFLKASEEIKVKEVNIIIDFLEKTKFNIDKINNSNEGIKTFRQNLENEKQGFKFTLEENNKELESFNEIVEEKRKNYYENQSKQQHVLGEVKRFEEKIGYLDETINRLKKEVLIKTEAIKKEEENIYKRIKTISLMKTEEEEMNKKIVIKDEEVSQILKSVLDYNIKLKELEELKFKNHSQINSKTSEMSILNNNIELSDESIENLILDVQTYNNSIIINGKTKDGLLEEEKTTIKNILTYEEAVKSNRKKFTKNKHDAEVLERNLKDIVRIQGNKEARLNALVTLEKSYEGYNKSVKLLMQYISDSKIYKINSDCYVLGDIIKVPVTVEKAIEIAMGASISNIVTKDETIAKNLINYLKTSKIGRATFMPINIVKGKNVAVDKSIIESKGYIGIASELIQFDGKFKGIVDQVLGKTLICGTMDDGLHISKISGHKYRIVTLDGEVFNPGGSLTGGSYSKNANVIGRKREIQELTETIEKSHLIVEEKNKEINDLNQVIKRLDDEGLNLRDEIHSQNINITKIRGEISKVIEEEERNKKEVERASESLAKENDKIKIFKSKLININTEIEKLNENVLMVLNEFEEFSSKTKDKNIYVDKLKEELTTIRISKAKIMEMISSNSTELERVKRGIVFEKKVISDNLEAIEKSILEKQEYELKINNSSDDVKSIIVLINELEEYFKKSEVERIRIKGKIPVITSKIEDINLQLDKLEKEIHRNEISLAKIESEEESLLKKLNEEYNLTFAEGLTFKIEGYDINILKNEVIILRKQISDLGLVNLGAIEEFKEVNEKYMFMNEQREDLVQSKEEIVIFIGEITDKMKSVFMSNFKQLRIYFNETFKELFKGGSADLTLQGDDELTCKIEIDVEPPGKKLQNINLLSGGEKVLSAIALLFAILKMKPTPFCILDEIEAALDDANVLRYGEFLKMFSKHIQFIVITHRKGTMETSDMIYGVTMEEKGVSKVVSLEFTKS
ncbi:MAG: chromosome segregation protein SMC [Clostridium sp.]|uniref:chromosome segregation protein SMC n=1 Tax=Clostridium sp. TaxID=1506 RepID=UPI00305CCB00